ncbi:hypothetical protein [Wolbachia pipientis]|uniref:hypothetical protein n=1 Tax=Wolbachia pipientis TaxID=955 RepID=UPI0025A399E9|nr:hypothetical protein [Wolbachia pipientis]MDM8335431.1 hypothetical protein [Wolbachia pipientis]
MKDYKANSKSLLDDIKEYFTDADNAVIEPLIASIGEGPKSFVVDRESLNSDKGASFVTIPENSVFNLGKMVKLVKEAVVLKMFVP